jgi:hypothetical protein
MLGARDVKRAKMADDETKELRRLRVARLVYAVSDRAARVRSHRTKRSAGQVRQADVRRTAASHNVGCAAFSALVALRPNKALLLPNAGDCGGGRSATAFYLSVRSRTPFR